MFKSSELKGNYKIRIDFDRELSAKEAMWVFINFYRNNPELSKKLISTINEGKVYCPFPFECNKFPCKIMSR